MRSDFDADVLEWVDVLVPNESEFTALVNHLRLFKGRTFLESEIELMSNDDLQALCRRFEVPNVILTLGERGSFVSKRDDYRLIPARKDVEVVDTTGAGDAFVGGFAAGLEEADGNIYSAVEFATTVAGMCVSKRGTARSMPTRDEVFSIF
jgi:ribokinase